MSTVVITGSSRGFGFAQAKKFREMGYNVVLSGVSEQNLAKAKDALLQINTNVKKAADVNGKNAERKGNEADRKAEPEVMAVSCNVTDMDAVQNLWNTAVKTFGSVDIWINNAGVNQPDKPVYELTDREIEFMLDTDLKGTIWGSKVAFTGMKEQGFGQIFNVEGYGSNDAMMTGLSIYGTTKRAVTYFTQALAKESEELTAGKVKVSRLAPGIMITDFLKTANGGSTKVELPEKTKKVYNILGDYPETIVEYVVPKMIENEKNNARIIWLTNRRAFGRFLTAGFRKRDFFK